MTQRTINRLTLAVAVAMFFAAVFVLYRSAWRLFRNVSLRESDKFGRGWKSNL